MTQRELEADPMLDALGELHRAERTELVRLEQPAQELAALEPERAQALQDRLMHELFVAKVASSELHSSQAVISLPPGAAMMQPSDTSAVGQRRRRSRRAAWLTSAAATSVAIAAAVLLWVREPAAQPFDVTYTLVAPSPDASTRSATQATSNVYSLGRTLAFALRPAVRYDGALRVVCYAARERKLVQLDPEVELDPAGGARVVLSAGTLTQALDEGRWQLRFYVSPPSATVVSESEVRARKCPRDTRCLTFAARFVEPEGP